MKALFLIGLFLWNVMASPLEKRSTTRVHGNKVAVVSGIIINSQITQCFQNSGVDIAKAYASAIADQWHTHQQNHQGTGWIQAIQAQFASSNTQNLYCSTFNAVFTFGTQYSANVFATWARNSMGNMRRSKRSDGAFRLGDLEPDVYVSDFDLPLNHPYFGSSSDETSAPAITSGSNPVLAKRGWGSCLNTKCHFSFSSDQTGICRDSSFPQQNKVRC
jgi:hypothetical protein